MRLAVLLAAFAFTPALADHGHGEEKAAAQMGHKDHCGFPAAEGRVVSS